MHTVGKKLLTAKVAGDGREGRREKLRQSEHFTISGG
jgi:hypothetical protein